MKKIKEYFEHYKTHDVCFQTTDGFVFHTDFDAAAHAHSLKDKKVEKFERTANKPQNKEEQEEPAEVKPKVKKVKK